MKKSLLLALPLLAAGCGDKAVTLAENPVERAATCGVVFATQARVNTTKIGAPLSIEAQGDILRPALLTGAQGPQFAPEQAEAVVKRMPELADTLTDGDRWEQLSAPCAAAYPTPAAAPALPDDPLTAALGCDQLSRFMNAALSASGDYEEQLFQYGRVEQVLDGKMAPLLARRGLRSDDAQATEKRKALSVVAKLGHPVKVMDACVSRYV